MDHPEVQPRQHLQPMVDRLQATNAQRQAARQQLHSSERGHRTQTQKLIPQEDDLENILAGIDTGAIVLDPQWRICMYTQSVKIAVAVDDGDIGKRVDAVDHHLDYEGLSDDIRSVLNHAQTIQRHVRTTGGASLLMRIHPGHLNDAGEHGAVMTFVDVSQVVDAEQGLRQLNEQLQQKNQEMEDFAYTISHDLKSPLVTIGGLLGLIHSRLGHQADPLVEDSFHTALQTVQKMGDSINDLLELSRVGRAKNDSVPVALGEIVHAVVDRLKGECQAKGVSVTIDRDLPVVQADPNRMEQLFDNLLVNALKYGCTLPKPRIHVGCQAAKEGVARVYVRDYGQGIPQESHTKVFGLFQRLDTDQDGTGVGLAIVKRIMSVHRGRVWVESNPGQGAAFWLEFISSPTPSSDATGHVPLEPTSNTRPDRIA